MSALIQVNIHASQFPEQVLADLRDSLRLRQLNHKFLYDSTRQTQKWLAVHEAYSPARTDPDCLATYQAGFEAVCARTAPGHIHLVGLGCGGGQKDAALAEQLSRAGRQVSYTPVDVSPAMVLTASQAVGRVLGGAPGVCGPGVVCDLQTARSLAGVLAGLYPPGAACLLSFFGLIPNFEPPVILPKLSELVRPGEALLLSANLAPGPDYAAGVRHILFQYNNALTNDWLLTALLDLGVERGDGTVVWRIEPCPTGEDLLRVAAYFRFIRPRILAVANEKFDFRMGDTLRLFFSYRYTPELVRAQLSRHGLAVQDQWLTPDGEEGVFLCEKMKVKHP
jgi:uncharacterized SAM-dependent methyltransferase